MNTLLVTLTAVSSALLFGCATPYSSTGFTGGYSDTQLAPDAFRIAFQGNGFTAPERAQDFALSRAADLTLSHGFRYFGIIGGGSGGNTSSITLPGSAYTTATATGYGNSAYGSAVTTFIRPTQIPIFKPKSALIIRCFSERPEGAGYVFDAQFLSNSFRGKYGIKT